MAPRGPPPGQRRRLEIIGIAVIALLVLGLSRLPFHDRLSARIEGPLLTARFLLRGPEAPGDVTVLALIDDRSMAALGNWPLSRAVLARTLDLLNAAGARVVGFDLLFLNREAVPTREGDPLAASLARAPRAILPFAFTYGDPGTGAIELPPALREAALAVVRWPADGLALRQPEGILLPVPELREAAWLAHVNIFLEADGNVRFLRPVLAAGETVLPSLPLEAARLRLGLPRAGVAAEMGAGLRLGDRFLTTDPAMRLALDFRGAAGSFPSFSLIDLLEERVPREAIAGRIVLIGATASGVGDRFATAFDEALPGVELLATAIDNLLRDEHLRRLPLLDLAVILAAMLALLLLTAVRRPLALLMASIAVVTLWLGVTQVAFQSAGLWLEMTRPAFVLLAGMLWIGALRLGGEHRRRRTAEQHGAELARYVTPLAAFTAGRGRSREDPGETAQAVVMFVDLRNFTGLAEQLGPSATARLLSPFHALVEGAIGRHGGIVDKFMGDGAMALFGLDGVPPGKAAAAALAAAFAMVEAHAAWARELRGRAVAPPRLGIGIHLGPVVLDETVGSHIHVVVNGDTVNAASRLEGLARDLAATLVVSDALLEAARAAGMEDELERFAPLPVQRLRGRRQPIAAWAWREGGD